MPHIPVLLDKVINDLNIEKDAYYIDCTFGLGGHSREIIKKGGKVIGLDIDDNTQKAVKIDFADEIKLKRLVLLNENFKDINQILSDLDQIGIKTNKIKGILYDLGVSTEQIKNSKIGLSFNEDSELDMRIDKTKGVKAIDLIKVLGQKDLAKILSNFGEVENSIRWARLLKDFVHPKESKQYNKKINAIDLGNFIKNRSGNLNRSIHPATKIFMALRIAVNDEFGNLIKSLDSLESLDIKTRVCIITFHSLEEKIVEDHINKNKYKNIREKPLIADEHEIISNPSARSAKLFTYEKYK